MAKITVSVLHKMKQQHDKIVMLTVYDATFAALQAAADIDVLLVGDSLGMVLQGHGSTLPVTLTDLIYHLRCVKRGAPQSFILADMPFLTYTDIPMALQHAGQLLQAGADMVKIEGGAALVPIVQAFHQHGIPVCTHLGLTPQFIQQFGGYKVQAKAATEAEQLVVCADKLQNAGADMLLLECIPAPLAARITQHSSIPVIGIGAGPDCDGQVLVMHDLLGASTHRLPRFVQNFLTGQPSIQAAFSAYRDAVKHGQFPTAAHSYTAE